MSERIPQGRILEAGMWGKGGGWQPLADASLIEQIKGAFGFTGDGEDDTGKFHHGGR